MKTESTNTIIPQSPTIVKTVGLYGRVSTENQETEGTSLDTQRASCLAYCKEHGYQVTHQFIETWSGLSLERPKLDELRQLIRNEEISAVIVYSLDRLTRQPNDGVILRMEREKHHVELLCVTETVDSSKIGQLMEYIYNFASSLEADRLRDRMGRGTKARVFDKKLPVTFREPYGYTWDRENRRLLPNDDYQNAKLILNLALEGKTYGTIITELKKRGIPSPGGLITGWNKCTISRLIHNPLYAGLYYAFKTQVTEPKKRNGNTYGKSSVIRLPQEQWHHIPEIEIVEPPLTVSKRALLLDQLQQRQKLASRNAKRNYLLRGFIYCDAHLGKQGKPRVYHGIPKRDTYYYICPVGGCQNAYIKGPDLDNEIKAMIYEALLDERGELYRRFNTKQEQNKLERQLKDELKEWKSRASKTLILEAKTEDRYMAGEIDADIYHMLKAKYKTQRQASEDKCEQIQNDLMQLNRQEEAKITLRGIRKLLGNVNDLTNDKLRQLFTLLRLEIHPPKSGHEAKSKLVGKPSKLGLRSKHTFMDDIAGIENIVVKLGIPLETKPMWDIALPEVEPG